MYSFILFREQQLSRQKKKIEQKDKLSKIEENTNVSFCTRSFICS